MKRTWTSEELLEHFTLLPGELTAIGNKSGATRLGFAVLLKCLQYEGRFPRSRQEVAPEVVRFLATQVGVDTTLFAKVTHGKAGPSKPTGHRSVSWRRSASFVAPMKKRYWTGSAPRSWRMNSILSVCGS
jgi:hypothetical protein